MGQHHPAGRLPQVLGCPLQGAVSERKQILSLHGSDSELQLAEWKRVRTFVLPSFFFLLINVFGFFFFSLLLLLNARSAYKCTPLLSPSHQKSWQAPEQGLGCTLKASSPKSACLIFGPPSQRVSIYTSDVKLQFVVPRGSRSHVLSAQLGLRFGCFQLHKTQQNQQLDIG